MIRHRPLYGRKWPSLPSLKMKIMSPQNKSSPRTLKFTQPLATRYTKTLVGKKIYVGGCNNDANTYY